MADEWKLKMAGESTKYLSDIEFAYRFATRRGREVVDALAPTEEEVRTWKDGRKIDAIRMHRARLSFSLVEAKEAFERRGLRYNNLVRSIPCD